MAEAPKPLTMEEMLARLPDKPFISTPEVQYATGVHVVTVYRWVAMKLLTPRRVRSRGRPSMFRRAEVVRLIRSKFVPTNLAGGRSGAEGDGDDRGTSER